MNNTTSSAQEKTVKKKQSNLGLFTMSEKESQM